MTETRRAKLDLLDRWEDDPDYTLEEFERDWDRLRAQEGERIEGWTDQEQIDALPRDGFLEFYGPDFPLSEPLEGARRAYLVFPPEERPLSHDIAMSDASERLLKALLQTPGIKAMYDGDPDGVTDFLRRHLRGAWDRRRPYR